MRRSAVCVYMRRAMLRNLRELYDYRALLLSLTQRELKARYRGSVLGFLWTFLNPLLLMLVYALVFGVLMHQSIPHYAYFLFVGLLPWVWFQNSVCSGASAISDRRDLLTKVRFPAQVLPATVIAINLVNFVLTLPLMIALGWADGVWPTWHIVALPLVLVVQLVFTLALTYGIAAFNVFFRDLQHIVVNVVTLWFYATPVLYFASAIPQRFHPRLILGANPMAVLILAYQDIFYEHRLPPLEPLAGVLLASLVLLAVTSRIFDARREDFAELI